MYIYTFTAVRDGEHSVAILTADTISEAWEKARAKCREFGGDFRVTQVDRVCLVAELMTTDGYWVW